MTETSTGGRTEPTPVTSTSGERYVYFMPDHGFGPGRDDSVSLGALWDTLWNGKWIVIAVTMLFAAASVTYALLATEWYRAEVLLAPADAKSTTPLPGQLEGLAALAGVSVGGRDMAEAVAVLRSREFAREFIEENGLLQVLFSDEWDSSRGQWKEDDPAKWPDVRDAVKRFRERILIVREDRKTGHVTLIVEWTDAETAAEWATNLVKRLNASLRNQAIEEGETNIEFLRSELSQTNLVTLQQSIGRLLDSELQKLMLARGNEEFAVKVLDPAHVPKQRSRPRRTVIAMVGTMAGGILAVVGVVLFGASHGHLSRFSEVVGKAAN